MTVSQKRGELALAIAETVANSISDERRLVVLESDDFPTNLRDILIHVRISRLGDDCWQPDRSGWVPKTDVTGIREIIEKKEATLSGYQKWCDSIWLLITSDGGSPSSWSEISNDIMNATFSTGFDRVFLQADFGVPVIELNRESIG